MSNVAPVRREYPWRIVLVMPAVANNHHSTGTGHGGDAT